MISVDYIGDIDQQFFHILFETFPSCCIYLYFVILVEDMDSSPVADEIQERMSRYIVDAKNVTKWPGTIQYNSNQKVLSIKCVLSQQSKEIFLTEILHLFYETNDGYAGDISILQKDGHPWFISTFHEKDSYFLIEMEGYMKLKEKLGDKLHSQYYNLDVSETGFYDEYNQIY